MELIIPCFKFLQFENAMESINRAFSKHDGKYKPSMLNLRGKIYSASGIFNKKFRIIDKIWLIIVT